MSRSVAICRSEVLLSLLSFYDKDFNALACSAAQRIVSNHCSYARKILISEKFLPSLLPMYVAEIMYQFVIILQIAVHEHETIILNPISKLKLLLTRFINNPHNVLRYQLRRN